MSDQAKRAYEAYRNRLRIDVRRPFEALEPHIQEAWRDAVAAAVDTPAKLETLATKQLHASYDEMPYQLREAVMREEARHVAELSYLVNRWPQYRRHLAYGLLGGAIAVCDRFGGDVEGFVRELRRREPMPPVLVPSKTRQS